MFGTLHTFVTDDGLEPVAWNVDDWLTDEGCHHSDTLLHANKKLLIPMNPTNFQPNKPFQREHLNLFRNLNEQIFV